MASESSAGDSRSVSLNDEDAVREVLVGTIFNLWDAVNSLTRLRPSRKDRYQVTVFGSARAQPGTFAYDEVRRIARALAERGCDVITGGGPGLMQAANEGAAEAGVPERGRSFGIRVDLPFEQHQNPFLQQAFEHRTFFTRLHQFVLMSDAYVVAPGGIGTVLELMLIWQLLQVRHIRDAPLILVGKMWDGLIDWARESLLAPEPALANPEDIAIPQCVASADEALTLLQESHARWLATRS